MDTDSPLRDLAIVDPDALDKLRAWGSDDLVRKMLDLFFQHAPARIVQIRDGIDGGTLELAERGAHSLKSSAGNLGARRLQVVSQRMESLAGDGEVQRARILLPQLEAAFQEARETLGQIHESIPE